MLVFNLDVGPAERFTKDPGTYAAEFDLSDDERQALCGKDVATLYGMGVQPFVVVAFAQFVRGKPFTSGAEMMAFLKEYAAQVAPYGHPDYGT